MPDAQARAPEGTFTKGSSHDHILKLIPSFCWQDCMELCGMLDAYGVTLDPQHVLQMVAGWGEAGLMVRKPCNRDWGRTGHAKWLYRAAG